MFFHFSGGTVKKFTEAGEEIHPFLVETIAKYVKTFGRLNTVKFVLEMSRAFGPGITLLESKLFVEACITARGVE